jgi:hypothetical protein
VGGGYLLWLLSFYFLIPISESGPFNIFLKIFSLKQRETELGYWYMTVIPATQETVLGG